MSLKRIALVSLVLAMLLLPVGITGRRLAHAEQSLARAEAMMNRTARDAGEVVELRVRQQRIEHRQRPQEHVLAQANTALADAGIPSHKLQSVRPEADVALTGTGHLYRRQSVLLSFQNLTLVELGNFLDTWRQSQITWIPQRLELTKRRGTNTDNNVYDASILIAAIYLAESQEQ